MSEIKVGDFVQVVKGAPCCGDSAEVGWVAVAGLPPDWAQYTRCARCGHIDLKVNAYFDVNGKSFLPEVLKKIDPPASGELKGVPLRLKEPA